LHLREKGELSWIGDILSFCIWFCITPVFITDDSQDTLLFRALGVADQWLYPFSIQGPPGGCTILYIYLFYLFILGTGKVPLYHIRYWTGLEGWNGVFP
jgi:hypothetical protein